MRDADQDAQSRTGDLADYPALDLDRSLGDSLNDSAHAPHYAIDGRLDGRQRTGTHGAAIITDWYQLPLNTERSVRNLARFYPAADREWFYPGGRMAQLLTAGRVAPAVPRRAGVRERSGVRCEAGRVSVDLVHLAGTDERAAA